MREAYHDVAQGHHVVYQFCFCLHDLRRLKSGGGGAIDEGAIVLDITSVDGGTRNSNGQVLLGSNGQGSVDSISKELADVGNLLDGLCLLGFEQVFGRGRRRSGRRGGGDRTKWRGGSHTEKSSGDWIGEEIKKRRVFFSGRGREKINAGVGEDFRWKGELRVQWRREGGIRKHGSALAAFVSGGLDG